MMSFGTWVSSYYSHPYYTNPSPTRKRIVSSLQTRTPPAGTEIQNIVKSFDDAGSQASRAAIYHEDPHFENCGLQWNDHHLPSVIRFDQSTSVPRYPATGSAANARSLGSRSPCLYRSNCALWDLQLDSSHPRVCCLSNRQSRAENSSALNRTHGAAHP